MYVNLNQELKILKKLLSITFLTFFTAVLGHYSAATPWWHFESCGDPQGTNNRIHSPSSHFCEHHDAFN